MRKPHLVHTAGFALLFALRAGLGEAQAPQCSETSATIPEDSTLEQPLPCAQQGRLVGLEVGYVRTVAGNEISGWAGDGGFATAASLNLPHGIAVDGAGNLYIAYIADSANQAIRRVDGRPGSSPRLPGAESPASMATGVQPLRRV